jgi:hypothetical protein
MLPILPLAPVLMLVAVTATRPLADPWEPGQGAVGNSAIDGFIDIPAANASFHPRDPLPVRGWVVDKASPTPPGIDHVQLYIRLNADETDHFLEDGSVGHARPDVPKATGMSSWLNAGFEFNHSHAPDVPGQYELTIMAHSPDHGWWRKATSITVIPVPPPPEHPCVDMICDDSLAGLLIAVVCFMPLAVILGIGALAFWVRALLWRHPSTRL